MKRQPQTETESWQTITYRRSVLLWSVVLLTRHGEGKSSGPPVSPKLFHRTLLDHLANGTGDSGCDSLWRRNPFGEAECSRRETCWRREGMKGWSQRRGRSFDRFSVERNQIKRSIPPTPSDSIFLLPIIRHGPEHDRRDLGSGSIPSVPTCLCPFPPYPALRQCDHHHAPLRALHPSPLSVLPPVSLHLSTHT